MGIRADLLHTAYIGTKFAERQYKVDTIDSKKPFFTIIYMGYMRKDKGFYFLLNALDQLGESVSKTIDVVFATKITDKDIIDSINNTAKKYHLIRMIDGYTHDTLPEILKGVDLGIVPVLWEDNLPQVAIEMAAHGVPVLCSNLGGACELSSSELYQFEGGNQKDFEDKLVYLIEHREQLVDYWSKYKGLKTMNDHIRELYSYYGYNSN
jgi:glycosyltransferase involved in cell wall biosynthesis